jgi:hypothetical protein
VLDGERLNSRDDIVIALSRSKHKMRQNLVTHEPIKIRTNVIMSASITSEKILGRLAASRVADPEG